MWNTFSPGIFILENRADKLLNNKAKALNVT
jgi:hypothetical protein